MKLSKTMSGVLTVVLGVLLCIFQGEVLNWVLTVAGAVIIVSGIIACVSSNMKFGLILIAVGVLVILGSWLFITVCLIFVGAILIIYGIKKILDETKTKKFNAVALIKPILTTILGIALICAQGEIINIACIIAGVLTILNGITQLLNK